MNGNQSHPLTQADCDTCLRILQQSVPARKAELEAMERAGWNLEGPKRDNEANGQAAYGILREYFPDRVPFTPPK